jgi:GNAT superfamily N-acetyltransferase
LLDEQRRKPHGEAILFGARENWPIAGEIVTRAATVDDVDFMLANLIAGFETFAEFAPEGWRPPPPDRERTLSQLSQENTWAMLALADGREVGHVAFMAARGNPFEDPDGWRERAPNPGQAHLWQLFVEREHWGTGIAGLLHDAALEEMAEQGYERARLFTPAGQHRARRFYERRGWRSGAMRDDPTLALRVVEYRVELSPDPGRPAPRRP